MNLPPAMQSVQLIAIVFALGIGFFLILFSIRGLLMWQHRPKEWVTRSVSGYRVQGKDIINTETGKRHIFLGIAMMGFELYKNPDHINADSVKSVHEFGANAVRLPFNQVWWLTDDVYRQRLQQAITMIEKNNMDVLLDLHWSNQANPTILPAQQRMPDTDSLECWRQLAQLYKDDPRVLFELYNEPHDVSAEIWRNGGQVDQWEDKPPFQAVGMQQLVDVIRAQGARNIIIANGLEWGYTLHFLTRTEGAKTVVDQNMLLHGENIAYGTHPYDFPNKSDPALWKQDFGLLMPYVPVMITEFGSEDFLGQFHQKVLDWARVNDLSYFAWAWYKADDDRGLLDSRGELTGAGRVVQEDMKR